MRWIIRLLGVVLVLMVVFVGALLMLPGDRIARFAEAQVKSQTGRDLRIGGDVNITLWPVIGVRTGPVTLSNADWASDAPMFEADAAAISVETSSLFGGAINIKGIEAVGPKVRLARDAQGRGNWEFGEVSGVGQTDEPVSAGRAISLGKLSITDAFVQFDDNGTLTELKNVDVNLDWPDPNGPAALEISLQPANQVVAISATVNAFQGFLGGQVQPVDFMLSTLGGDVSLTGRASLGGAFAGKVDTTIAKPNAFFAALGLAPIPLGADFRFAGDVTLTEAQALSVRAGQLGFMGNQVSVEADVRLDGVPQVNAKLNAATLDLSGFNSNASGDAATASAGWSKDIIDASGLAAFNGEIGLVSGGVKYGDIALGKTRMLLTVDRSRAVFDLREVQAFEGVLSGQFVMNNRSGLSVGGALIAQKMALQPLMSSMAGLDRLSGPLDAEVKFLASGGSVDALMRSLSGEGAVKLGQGSIRGINLDALMKTGSGSGTTVFESLGAKFTIQDGALRNDDLLMLLPNYQAKGAGVIGLGDQTLDYTFTPIALRANSGEGLAIPVRISGPWADPKIRPDLQAAIDLNFSAEKERIEQQAKERIEQKLQEELGVVTEEGQSVEDAVKDKVEDEVKRGLLRLLE